MGTGDYPGLDAAWHHYTSPSHPNTAKLSDFEKSNVEELCITSRHQRAAGQTLEELLVHLPEVASDEDKGADAKAVASSIITALQHLYVAIEHTKNMLDDMGQKWKHTPDQFETNRLFASDRNPDDESLAVGPGIFNLFKRQVNAYGELAAYKRDCGKLVPKTVVQVKTDCRAGSVSRTAKPKRQ